MVRIFLPTVVVILDLPTPIRDYSAPVESAAAGAALKDTWSLSDLDMASMGLMPTRSPPFVKS